MVSLIERNTTAVNLVERASLRLIAVVKRNRTKDCGQLVITVTEASSFEYEVNDNIIQRL